VDMAITARLPGAIGERIACMYNGIDARSGGTGEQRGTARGAETVAVAVAAGRALTAVSTGFALRRWAAAASTAA
jgi:hypothetical protein